MVETTAIKDGAYFAALCDDPQKETSNPDETAFLQKIYLSIYFCNSHGLKLAFIVCRSKYDKKEVVEASTPHQ